MEDDTNVQIPLSSLLILGDLLSLIGNTEVATSDLPIHKKKSEMQSVLSGELRCFSVKKRDVVSFAELYLSRSDTSAAVRQNALQVWKSVVLVNEPFHLNGGDSAINEELIVIIKIEININNRYYT